MKVELSLHAISLKNVAGVGRGTSDPFAVVTQLSTSRSQSANVLGKTEIIKNTLSPQWTKVFLIDYELGTPMKLVVSIVDHVSKGDNKPMGSAVFDVGEILGARGNTKARKLKHGGTLFAHVRKAQGSGMLRLKMKGNKLKSTEGMGFGFRKSDPFFELSRQILSAGNSTWDNVFRSPFEKSNLNPEWDTAVIEISVLCGGDLDLPILVSVFDHESSGKHVPMGQFETTVNGLVAAGESGSEIELMKKGDPTGSITVVKADVAGAEGESVEESEEPAAAKVAAAVAPTATKPSFVDYVSGGCQLSVVTAIDYTGSNGNPRQPGTLHYLSPDGAKNDYEKAISAILTVLSKYDTDKMYEVLGFGAKYDGVVNHAFQCGDEPQVHGIEGVLKAYRQVFSSGLIMSSPTDFTHVIRKASEFSLMEQEKAQADGKQAYTILLIVSDGAVSDVQATAECLKEVSDSPLSIVIVGVGNADFSAMQFLDDSAGASRDIAQFVEFNKHHDNRVDLSAATLKEIPGQLVGYFQSKDIPPLPPVVVEEEEIVVEEEEEEIDLSLDFGNEEEIVVAAGGVKELSW